MNNYSQSRLKVWKTVGGVLLAFSMLFYTGYVSVTALTCQMSGAHSVSIGNGDKCCEQQDHHSNAITPACCASVQSTASFASFKQWDEWQSFFTPLAASSFTFPLSVFYFSESFGKVNHSLGIPILGWRLLIHICKYAI